MERPDPPGNARAHPLSGDRRITLHDHAVAIRLLLVPASGARQVGARRPIDRSRIRDPRRAARRDLGVAGPYPQRIRTRCPARTSGADPLVSRTFAGGDTSHPDLGYPVLRYWRQPALAGLFPSGTARCNDALRIADADRVGAFRSRTL